MDIKAEGNRFHLRGLQMTRLEAFVDAAFAFSVTLLVISVESVPKSYAEFSQALESIPAFLASFLQLMMFWLGHRSWSRRYGLDDLTSVALSLALVAGILVLVYPLRVMFTAAISHISDGAVSGSFEVTLEQIGNVFAIYGLGFGVLCGIIALLHAHAFRRRTVLSLNEYEQVQTLWDVYAWCILSSCGFIALMLSQVLQGEDVVYAGWIYSLLAILMPLHAYLRAQKIRQIVIIDAAKNEQDATDDAQR